MSLESIVRRNQEKIMLKNIRKTYGKKPKDKCPICHKKSLFMKNKDGEIFCIRCNSKVS